MSKKTKAVLDNETIEATESVSLTNPVSEEMKEKINYCEVVNCDKLRVRSEPSTDAEVVTLISKGTKMIFKNKYDDTWSQVQTLTGRNGYVMSKFIKRV